MTLEEYIDTNLVVLHGAVTAWDLAEALHRDGYRVVKLVEQTNEHGVLLSTAVAEELT